MASQATRRAPKAIDSYAQKLIRWRDHPAMMVREEFGAEPDAWQEEVLEAFPHQQRIALPCAKGVGKTCVEAWLGWNFILTRPHANVAMTSISGRNLQDGLWKELAKWQAKSELLKLLFEIQATRVVAKEAPKTWFMSARTWQQSASAEEQASTLAGFHAENVLFILDETGDMPAAVMVSAEAALSTGTDMKIMQAGNTTRREGPLWRACTADRERWYVVRISGDPDDAKRSPRISLDWCKQMIAAYGRQSDWVKVNVFGEFPDHAINALIGPDEIDAAEKRSYREHDIAHAARLLGVDVAREGNDCFDSATEILTDRGWMLFSELTGEERVLSLNGDVSSWEAIDRIVEHDFDGEMNLLEKRHINFCVTDKHRFLVKSNPKSANYCFREYHELPQEFIVRSNNTWGGESPEKKQFIAYDPMPNGGLRRREWQFDFLDWASFLGWFVSEGSVWTEKRERGRTRISIAQKPGRKRELLKELLIRMGLCFREQDNQLEITNAVIGDWLNTWVHKRANNKRVPVVIKDGAPAVIRAFLDAFLLGDGTCRADGYGRAYVTSSKLLADDLQEMMAKLGVAGSCRLKESAGSVFEIEGRQAVRAHDTYVIYERSKFTFGKSIRKTTVKRVRYKGKIWCVSTRFQSIYVRRKGVSMWSGNSSVMFPRQGLVAFEPTIWRNIDGIQGAGAVARKWDEWGADACFVDNTGGFGASWIDCLRLLGRQAIPVVYSAEPHDRRYFNKRAEIYFLATQWIKDGGQLPKCPELTAALTQITYTHRNDRLLLEDKGQLKTRLGFSPDVADSFCQTFSEPIVKAGWHPPGRRRSRHRFEYDPYAIRDDERIRG